MKTSHKITLFFSLITLLLSACGGDDKKDNTPTPDVGAIYTQAFHTLIAEYTKNAPTATSTTQPTQTLIPPTATFTDTPLPTASLVPTLPPTFTPVPYVAPPPTSPPASGGCDCSSDSKNCGDFSTHAQAQACYDSCKPGDIHRLDQNNDGIACESLP